MKLLWAKKKKNNKRRNPNLMDGQDDYIFRRSRTITGTKAEGVATSASARSQFKTDRIKQMERKGRNRKIFRLIAVGALVLACAVLVVLNLIFDHPKIKGAPDAQVANYQKSINKYLAAHPLERLTFLLQQDQLLKSVVIEYPEVKTLSFSHDWYGGNVEFLITYRTPLIVWKTADKKFYVDASGIAFTYNSFAEPTLEVVDQSGVAPDQSGVVASTKFIRFLGQIVGAVNTYNKGTVTSVIIPRAAKEVDLKLQGREYIIKTNTDRDPLQEAEDINNMLTYFDQRGIVPQYADARVAHKAFYK